MLLGRSLKQAAKPTKTTNFSPPFLPPVSFTTWPTFGLRKLGFSAALSHLRLLPPCPNEWSTLHQCLTPSFLCSKEFGSIPTCPRPSGWSLLNLTRRSANPSRWSLHQLCHSLHLCTLSPDVSSTKKPFKTTNDTKAVMSGQDAVLIHSLLPI